MKKEMRNKQLIQELVSDLRVCISYEPDRDNDLLCMMEQYLKTERKRKDLLPEIKKLLNGESYRNPYQVFYFYTEEDIEAFVRIMDDYVSNMKEGVCGEFIFETTIAKVNELHKLCRGELIDDWRKEKLEKLLLSVAKQEDVASADLILKEKKRW